MEENKVKVGQTGEDGKKKRCKKKLAEDEGRKMAHGSGEE